MKDSTKSKLRETILFKPDLYVFVNIAIAVGINLIGFFGARALSLPLWLDTIGTMLVSIAYGPLAGAITALLSSSFIIIPLGLPLPIFFVGLSVALIVGFMFPRKRNHDLFTIVSVGMISALVTSLLSFPINILFNNGYPGNLWGDQFYMMVSKSVSSKEVCAYMSVAFIDYPDRLLSLLLAFTIFDIAKIHHDKKKRQILKQGMSGLLAVFMAASFFAASKSMIRAAATDTSEQQEEDFDYEADFDTVTYDADDGLLTSEANAVAQTRDGYIWVGTYAAFTDIMVSSLSPLISTIGSGMPYVFSAIPKDVFGSAPMTAACSAMTRKQRPWILTIPLTAYPPTRSVRSAKMIKATSISAPSCRWPGSTKTETSSPFPNGKASSIRYL